MTKVLILALAFLFAACTQETNITGPDCFSNASADGGGGGAGNAFTGESGGGAPGSASASSGCSGASVATK